MSTRATFSCRWQTFSIGFKGLGCYCSSSNNKWSQYYIKNIPEIVKKKKKLRVTLKKANKILRWSYNRVTHWKSIKNTWRISYTVIVATFVISIELFDVINIKNVTNKKKTLKITTGFIINVEYQQLSQ